MADSILRLKVESQEYDSKLKRAAEGIQRLAAKIHDSQGEFVGLTNDQKEFIRNLQYMNTVSQTATGKAKELETAYKGLQTMYNGFNAFEKNSEEGKILAEQLSILKEKTLQARKEMEDANKSLSNTGGFLDQLTSKFTVNIDALKLFDIGMKAAGAALDVAKDAFFASESTVDEWGRTMDASKSLYEGFLTALNTGDISGYLSRIDEIVSAARTAYNELDRLGTMKTIQAPRISAQQTENERMRMMIQTGRYIAPVDGRRAAMADGQKLTKEQIQRIEKQLQNGMKSVVGLVSNEVKQTGRAIDAVYKRQAAELGMNIKEFRSGTSSMAEFDKRMQGYDNYQKWRASHTTIDQQSGREIVARGNPFEQFSKWGVFRVDGDRYNDLVKLIQQRDQQAAQAYSMQGQTYRTMNRAEGVTVRSIMNGGTGGGGVGTTSPVPVKIEGFDTSKSALAAAKGVDTMPSVYGMADRDAMRAAMGIATPQWDAKQDVSKSWHIGMNGDLTQNPNDKRKDRDEKKLTEQISKLTSGISSITGGIKAMGFELPNEVEQVIGVVQGVMAVIEGVNSVISIFGSTSMALNTIALDANTAALWAVAGTNLIPGLARGGIVPKAADGYLIPGNNMSGDNVFAGNAWVNSGELVLSKAQQGNLASQLSGSGLQNLHLTATVHAEQIRLALNNNGQRTGRGELVTWKR